MRKVPKQPKFKIYQCLWNLNSAFESIGREIEVLDDFETIPVEALGRYRLTAEELRSAMNRQLLEILAGRESKEWELFERELRKRQANKIEGS